jgi:hypothetical protein
MKFKFLGAAFLAAVLLAGCSGENAAEEKTENTSSTIETQNIKEMVSGYSTGEIEAESASITSDQLIVNETEIYDLPKDEFFVSIAPYIAQTHPCGNHSLTGCQGELVKEEFGVYIEDEDGNVVVDETMTSQENGFIDFWLPRDKTYQVKIEQDGKTVQSEISTFTGDNTCITTMQLKS